MTDLFICVLFQYMPPVDSRSCAGFVGLKNGGATCYMNSLLQQLYMIPGIPESILSIDDELASEERLLAFLHIYVFLCYVFLSI